ncbi:MAG: HAD-IIA family hydrolase [Planctomycetota bacterium]
MFHDESLGKLVEETKGFLIDLDGTLYVGDELIAGAADFVHALRTKGIPHAFVTNITSRCRAHVLARIEAYGLEIEPEQVLTAPIATKAYLDRQRIGSCYFLTRPTLVEDFAGHPQNEDEAEAVVIGDMGETITFQHLNQAFRLLGKGAAFVTMSRSKFFRTKDGMTLDAGAFVALLEHASDRRAIVTGKPSKDFFRAGLDLLDLPPSQVAMIGDDLESDVRGAQACGVAGLLVMSGKTTQLPPSDSPVAPDGVCGSVSDLIRFL